MKFVRWLVIFVCLVLFVAGLLIRVDAVDARECRQVAAVMFILAFLTAPLMWFMVFVMRCLSKVIVQIAKNQSVGIEPIRTMPFKFFVAIGVAYLSFSLGGFVGAIWKGSASFWAALVAAGFGGGLLLGYGACDIIARKVAKRG